MRKKFKSLKRGLDEAQEAHQKFFTPVLEPLEGIKEELRKQSVTDQIKQVSKERPVMESTMIEPSSMWWEQMEPAPQTPTIYQRETLIPPDVVTPSTSKSDLLPPPPVMVKRENEDEERQDEEVYETTEPLSEQLLDFVRTPKGEEELKEHLRSAGPLQRQYLFKLFKGGHKRDFDSRYGIRIMPNGVAAIGDSTDVQMFPNSDDISINGVVYEGTPGLLELLYMNSPKDYTEADLKNYKQILLATNAHKRGYSEERGLGSSKSEKYKKVIGKIFPSKYLSTATAASSPIINRKALRSYVKKGTGLMNANTPIYERWNDPNELVDRLKLLMASATAGHEGHENEIQSIIEELREENIIY